MRNINDIKIETCSSSADLVAYLYDELGTAERSLFETHLLDCGKCTDEFAELSFARLDVYEWHRDEFVPLETPRFVIPYSKAAAKKSWLDGLRGFLTSHGQWATAGGAFALAAVVFGAVYVSSLNKTVDMASNNTPEIFTPDRTQPINSPAIPPVEAKKEMPAVSPALEITEGGPSVVKASTPRKVPKPANSLVTVHNISQPVVIKSSKAPRLNDFEDEDDNTLRLGDLLADVDTRK